MLCLWAEQEELFLLFPRSHAVSERFLGCAWHTMVPDRDRAREHGNARQQDINVTAPFPCNTSGESNINALTGTTREADPREGKKEQRAGAPTPRRRDREAELGSD